MWRLSFSLRSINFITAWSTAVTISYTSRFSVWEKRDRSPTSSIKCRSFKNFRLVSNRLALCAYSVEPMAISSKWTVITDRSLRRASSAWFLLVNNHTLLISGRLTNSISRTDAISLISRLFLTFRPSDTIWRQRSRSTLAQIMAYCLTAPSHYMKECWFNISKVHWYSFEYNFTRDTSAISH